jgi:hypothetical protein
MKRTVILGAVILTTVLAPARVLAQATGQTTRGARVMPAYALVRPTFSVAQSWYDSLQASVRMLPSNGLNFLASYTLGKTTDHVSGLNIGGEARPVLPVTQGDEASLERALELEKGPALFDARHRFVISFGYELPRLDNSATLVRAIAGGWQLNGIYQAQTGFPLTVTQGTVLDIRYMTSRPDMTCDANDGPQTTAQWFNTSCFATLTLAQTGERPGNAGRNTVPSAAPIASRCASKASTSGTRRGSDSRTA